MHMHITPCYNLPRQLYRDQRDVMFLCLVVLPNGISETIKHHMLNVTVSTIDGERESDKNYHKHNKIKALCNQHMLETRSKQFLDICMTYNWTWQCRVKVSERIRDILVPAIAQEVHIFDHLF